MNSYIPFTEQMKNEYTILIPTMLPMHFRMIISVLKTYGYNIELLEESGPHIAETGLKYVHNDTCYPAILVIGQFINALNSGKYDPHKTALMLFQTGGGCRASNYISLLRKALKNAGLDYIPVISFSFMGIERHPGFKMSIPKLHRMLYGILYADLLMSLVNQCRPYEINSGQAQILAERWVKRLSKEMGEGGSRLSYRKIKQNYKAMVEDFAGIPMAERPAVRVGVVGEIFVKYSPLGNNNLEQFLVDEGAQVTVPGLTDFLLYCVYNNINDYRVYKRGSALRCAVIKLAFNFLSKKTHDVSDVMIRNGLFEPFSRFEDTIRLSEGYIGKGAKMGEGWLLTAEMLELAEAGIKNIVCTQPFGCLPNHICGKGMMRIIKERNPDVNIVAIDYDAGATQVNQINRLKLMLANAQPPSGVGRKSVAAAESIEDKQEAG